MANKSVYQDFDTDALTHFGLEQDTIYGVLSSSMDIDKVLCTQDKTTYEKINTILTVPTEDGTTFMTKKKAFILPKCNVSQDRLKAALKEHGITVTNDYTLADLIIGHEDIEIHRLENGNNIPSTIMMNKLWNYETTKGRYNATHPKEIAIYNSGLEVLLTPRLTESVRYYNLDIETGLYDEWMITGLALNLAHLIDTTDVSVVSPEIILHSSANKILMTEELLKDLSKLLSSYGDDNMAIAGKIIPTIDYTKNHHLLWKFSQDNYSNMYDYRRDKDVQYWIKESLFNYFYKTSAQDMIFWLERNEKLNIVSFRYLEPIVRREISISNRELYTFNVSVKKEYQQYLKK
mgnify:FL=1|tara:strand:- start:280 stop:1323 length:1044 start_codon:yes stop_codon:yes gene_type:complete